VVAGKVAKNPGTSVMESKKGWKTKDYLLHPNIRDTTNHHHYPHHHHHAP
jgi:hypothetical protein